MKQAILLGIKRSKGMLENGTSYDSTKLYVQTPMRESEEQKGFSVAEYGWGDSSNYDKLKHLSFPAKIGLDLEIVTTGKTSQIVVNDVEIPVQGQGIVVDAKKA